MTSLNLLKEEGFNTSLIEVVSSFIQQSDNKTYDLESDEYINEISTMSKRKYRIRKLLGENITPALSATDRQIIPNYYVVIKKKGY